MENVLKGLEILTKYFPHGDFAAEHDVIFAGDKVSEVEISKEDKEKLDQLGWWIDEETDSWARWV